MTHAKSILEDMPRNTTSSIHSSVPTNTGIEDEYERICVPQPNLAATSAIEGRERSFESKPRVATFSTMSNEQCPINSKTGSPSKTEGGHKFSDELKLYGRSVVLTVPKLFAGWVVFKLTIVRPLMLLLHFGILDSNYGAWIAYYIEVYRFTIALVVIWVHAFRAVALVLVYLSGEPIWEDVAAELAQLSRNMLDWTLLAPLLVPALLSALLLLFFTTAAVCGIAIYVPVSFLVCYACRQTVKCSERLVVEVKHCIARAKTHEGGNQQHPDHGDHDRARNSSGDARDGPAPTGHNKGSPLGAVTAGLSSIVTVAPILSQLLVAALSTSGIRESDSDTSSDRVEPPPSAKATDSRDATLQSMEDSLKAISERLAALKKDQ